MVIKPHFSKDIIRLIEELLDQEVDLRDVKKWLQKHPCRKNKLVCTKKEMKILHQLQKLTQKPINEPEWQKFRDQLKAIRIKRSACPER